MKAVAYDGQKTLFECNPLQYYSLRSHVLDVVDVTLREWNNTTLFSPIQKMTDTNWVDLAQEVVILGLNLAHKIIDLKRELVTTQEELARFKTVLIDLEERNGYDTVH